MPEERKLVTILFADVADSTALGEDLDPEDLRALMARYYDHALRIVTEHGGILEKFIGDAVMAIFGLPQAHSDDAERALASALALRAAVASDILLQRHLVLRMGANTGSVVATSDMSRGDFLVTGDAVNVAARVEQNAQPGEILVSERTASNAEASFIFGEAHSIAAKGKREPLRVFPLAEQRAMRQLGRPPLVGRARDLMQLTLLRDRTLRDHQPQLISLIAPAGTGKTRLLEEFLSHLFEEDGIKVATAHCLPYGQTLTYWPLRGLLEDLLGGDITHDAVARVFSDAAYADDDAQSLARQVLAALGVESAAQVESEALHNAWRLLIQALARQAPRIVVFEDLHWASESLLDLVEHTMQPRTQASLMVIATSRPDLLDRRPTWGGGRRNFTSLTLEPLTEQEIRSLIGALVDGAPEATRARIAERSGGNPYFAIELARGLRREATLDTLPDTVQEAVQERLDALPTRERAVLQAAAVAGRAFRTATVEAAMARDDSADAHPRTEIEAALDGLMERDLITATDAGGFTFRHILVRDVAYNALARAERMRLHLVVAQWLENFAAGRIDEFVELIAYHYSQAAQLARQSAVLQETPFDTARAVEYLERAAALAFQAGALIEARGHLERALTLAPASEHLRLQEELGDRSGVLSHVAIPAYRAALALWRAEPQPQPQAGVRIIRKLVMHTMRWQGGMTPGSAERAELAELRAEAWRLAEQAGAAEEQWRLRAADLFWYWWSTESPSNVTDLLASGWEAADHFEAVEDWEAFSEALDARSSVAQMVGEWDAVFSSAQRRRDTPALSLFERNDALNAVIWAQSDRGDYANAIATVHDLLAQRRPSELVTSFCSPIFTAREDAFMCGAWDEFARFDAAVEEIWQEADGRLDEPRLLRLWQGDSIFKMLIALARGDASTAERAAETLRSLAAQEPHAPRREALLGWIEAALGDDPTPLEAALRGAATHDDLDRLPVYRTACRFLSEYGQPLPETVLDLLAHGQAIKNEDAFQRWYAIARALADDDNARLATAIDTAGAHSLIPHAARMRVILAQRTGDGAQLDRARPALAQLGDTLFLRKLERV
ncbi:MAG: AAA family ATPase, partial [Chloroflexota bacterium]|nr:AAA family ATPase [Chloroflexota bacterium]